MDQIRIHFDNPLQPDSVEDNSWRDTWRHALGVGFIPEENWEIRGGFMYERTPIPNAESRGPRIPDNDQYWVGTGVSYKFTPNLRVSFNVAHTFFPDGKTRRTGPTGDVLQGTWKNSYDAISASLVWTL